MTRAKDPEYPQWVCRVCGENYGTWYKRGTYIGPPHHRATFHKGTCRLCNAQDVTVTEPRDYGHLRADWRRAIIENKNSQ